MGQHQSRIGGEGTQDMGGLAVMEAVKTPAQHLAVDRNRTPLRWAGLLVEDGGMAPKTCSIESASTCWMIVSVTADPHSDRGCRRRILPCSRGGTRASSCERPGSTTGTLARAIGISRGAPGASGGPG